MANKLIEDELDDELDGEDDVPGILDDEDNVGVIEDEVIISPIDHSERKIFVVEPLDENRSMIITVLNELLPGAEITEVEDIEDAAAIFVEDDYDTVIIDLRHEGFASSEFIKLANNDANVMIIAFAVDCMDTTDDKSKSKYEPLRKLFEFDRNLTKSK